MTTPGRTADREAATDIASLGERALIDRIRRRLPPPPASLVVDIGDDAAVTEIDRGTLQVLTTDALVEGVHFDRRFSSLADVGYKALAVNISDVAAMGGSPRLALLSLMLPRNLALADVDALLDGLTEIAAATKVTLAGGNITESPHSLIIDVAVTGAVKRRQVLRRGGGRAGDQLFVSGTIGAAAAGLEWLRANATQGTETPDDAELIDCVRRHRRPEPRARLGALLGRTHAATACMDLSDGLADAVRQVAESSGTGAVLDAARLPVHPAAARWFAARGADPVAASLTGGDDYELLFAMSSRSRGRLRLIERQARGVPVVRIGELTSDHRLIVQRDGIETPLPGGFVHF